MKQKIINAESYAILKSNGHVVPRDTKGNIIPFRVGGVYHVKSCDTDNPIKVICTQDCPYHLASELKTTNNLTIMKQIYFSSLTSKQKDEFVFFMNCLKYNLFGLNPDLQKQLLGQIILEEKPLFELKKMKGKKVFYSEKHKNFIPTDFKANYYLN